MEEWMWITHFYVPDFKFCDGLKILVTDLAVIKKIYNKDPMSLLLILIASMMDLDSQNQLCHSLVLWQFEDQAVSGQYEPANLWKHFCGIFGRSYRPLCKISTFTPGRLSKFVFYIVRP